MHINLETLQRGALSQNVMLRSGDTIFVLRAESVFVSGQVNRPEIRHSCWDDRSAGLVTGGRRHGSRFHAAYSDHPQVDGKEIHGRRDLQDKVKNGDTVLVRERFF